MFYLFTDCRREGATAPSEMADRSTGPDDSMMERAAGAESQLYGESKSTRMIRLEAMSSRLPRSEISLVGNWHATVTERFSWKGVFQLGFVFNTPRAGVARYTRRAGA